jgi:glycosyltransferase involved in cell wall biosynthesis
MPQISVVIITRNEERNIVRCIRSVRQVADEVLVLDSFSSDKTVDLASKEGAKVVQQQWLGYSASKNLANSLAQHPWILSLDADEELSDELIESVKRWKSEEAPVAAKINRVTNYCGKWIRHGAWYPDVKLRLFHRDVYQWKGLIHEDLMTAQDSPEPKLLSGDCHHYSYYHVDEHWKQSKKFALIAAKELMERKKGYKAFKLFFSPFVRFIRDYFILKGFKDGREGFTIAFISAHATYLKYYYLAERFLKVKPSES